MQANSKEEVLSALGEAVTGMRRDLGESLASLEQFDAPIDEATTDSLEALQAFTRGNIERDIGGDTPAIPFFERAIELDPDFAMAHARLGSAFGNQGQSEKAAEHMTRAYELRERVSEPERLYIMAHYYGSVLGDIDKSVETYELWISTYPRSWTAYNNVGIHYSSLGQLEKAIDVARKAAELAPDAAFTQGNLSSRLVGIGEWDEAREIYERAREKGMVSWGLTFTGVELAEREGDRATSEALYAERAGTSGEGLAAWQHAELEARHGELEDARELTRRSAELSRRFDALESESSALSAMALSEAVFGNTDASRELAVRALELSSGRDAIWSALVPLSLTGDREIAEDLMSQLDERYPRDTLIQSGLLPQSRAILLLRAGDPEGALTELETVAPFERSFQPAIQARGEALLAVGRPADAAVEFEKLIEWENRFFQQAIPRIARLWLGRAHMAAGNSDAARAAYEEFFEIMQNADDGIPLIEKARQEYATIPGAKG